MTNLAGPKTQRLLPGAEGPEPSLGGRSPHWSVGERWVGHPVSEPIAVALGMESSGEWPVSEAGPSLLKSLSEMAGLVGCPRMLGWVSSSSGVLPESLLPHRSADTPSTIRERFQVAESPSGKGKWGQAGSRLGSSSANLEFCRLGDRHGSAQG